MQVAETEIVIHRETVDGVLRHWVDGRGWVAARDAEVAELIAHMDRLGIDPALGKDPAGSLLREAGVKVANGPLLLAIAARCGPRMATFTG